LPASRINKNLLILHFTVVIWGFTGLIGALVTVSAVPLVWYRVLIASLSLFLFFKFSKTDFKVNRQMLIRLVFTGAILAAHWILFFGAIKLSTVSVTLVCLSSITLWTAIFEPLINKRRISRLEIIAGIIIITGILVIFKFEVKYTKGIIAGLLSALCGGLFPVFNGRMVKKITAPVIAFYELSGAFFWVTLFMLFTDGFDQSLILKTSDIGYLLILGTVCTSLAYVAGVSVMREFSAFRVALITNLEPVYGILLAIFFLHDLAKMTGGFWVGAVLILSTIILFPIAQKQLAQRKVNKT
jgi:drug/metabolite transporter (DMT)-like permease